MWYTLTNWAISVGSPNKPTLFSNSWRNATVESPRLLRPTWTTPNGKRFLGTKRSWRPSSVVCVISVTPSALTVRLCEIPKADRDTPAGGCGWHGKVPRTHFPPHPQPSGSLLQEEERQRHTDTPLGS